MNRQTKSSTSIALIVCLAASLTGNSLAAEVTVDQLNDLANRPDILLRSGQEVPARLNDAAIWQRWIEHEVTRRNCTLDSEYRNIAEVFKAQAEKIRGQSKSGSTVFWPAVLVQAAHETGFFQYKGDVPPRMTPDGKRVPEGAPGVPTYNFTGIAVTLAEAAKSKREHRVPGEFFRSKEDGALASLQHFAAYGGLGIEAKHLVAERTKEIQSFIPKRAKNMRAGRVEAFRGASSSRSPEVTFADLGADPTYRPKDQVNFRAGRKVSVRSLYGTMEVDPISKEWTVVEVQKVDGVVVQLEIKHKNGSIGWVKRRDLEIPGDFIGFRRGSMNYAGDRDYGGKVLTHWIAAAEFVSREFDRQKLVEEKPNPADLAKQVNIKPPFGPLPPSQPDPGDLGKQIKLVPPANPTKPTRPDAGDLAEGVKLVPPSGQPAERVPETTERPRESTPPRETAAVTADAIEPFYAIYTVHPVQFPKTPTPPPGTPLNQLMTWVMKRIDDHTVRDVIVSKQPSGKIAFRVEGKMLDAYAEHVRTSRTKPFEFFRRGAYQQPLNMFHPEIGYVRLPPLFLRFQDTTKEPTSDIRGAVSPPFKIPAVAGPLSAEKLRVGWPRDRFQDARIEALPLSYDRRAGIDWPDARKAALEVWQSTTRLMYQNFGN